MGPIRKCSICSTNFHEEDEGGISGFVGILPVNFCPTCYAGIIDMAAQFMCECCDLKDKPEKPI